MFRKLRVRRVLVVGFFVLLANSPVFADPADSNIQEGLNQYQEGLFPEAEKNFSQARSSRPEDPRLNYNLGSSYYKQEKFQEALQDYTHAALENSDPQLKKNSIYNSGNALFKMGKLEEAEAAYKKVLTLDPSDMDAKFNLEFVREQLKKKDEQKQESDKKDSSDSEKDDPSKKDSSNKEEDQESEKEEPQPGEKQPQENNQSEAAQAKELSQEEAEQLLGNLSEDLKKISRMQAGKTKASQSYQGSNW
ncbi:MAG: Ca-activated chloride channel family protein [Nitrospinales bacterium]|jgi:Ca-activated chloride channel family protein